MVDADKLAEIVADAIETATSPLLARIAELEQREHAPPRDGRDGEKGDKGERGSSITTGFGPPTFSAAAGDVYLDAKTGDIYQWR